MNKTLNCPVCGEAGCSKTSLASKANPFPMGECYDCRRCGSFILPNKYDQLPNLSSRQRALLSHNLRRMQRANGPVPEVSVSILPKTEDPLPSPAEQADNLILWIGDHQPSPAQEIKISEPKVSAWIGTAITPNIEVGDPFDVESHEANPILVWLLKQPPMRMLVEKHTFGGLAGLLTFEGWQHYETLKHAQVESHTAFMAMEFGHEELSQAFNDCFKPAVKAAGFELRLLTDRQPAGLIDDQLRVALRTARFVIADLTHGNNGAYWEAGFAEGLGRPVIYTCRKQKWDSSKSHFDTSHLNTIIWDPENLRDAETRLTATIRVTLPAEAKMSD